MWYLTKSLILRNRHFKCLDSTIINSGMLIEISRKTIFQLKKNTTDLMMNKTRLTLRQKYNGVL